MAYVQQLRMLDRISTNVFESASSGLRDLFRPPKSSLPALDVLRSAAILLVFTGHYVGQFDASGSIQRFPLFLWGWTGVDLFFVLSGFLIGSQLWKELDRAGKIRIGRFLIRRGLRIWPLYYSFVLLVLVRIVLGKSPNGFLVDVAFISNFLPGKIPGGWSLSTEEQFYVLTPILISIVALKWPPRRLWSIPIIAISASVVCRAWISANSGLSVADLHLQLHYPIYTHADGLAIGVLLAWVAVFHKNWLRSRTVVPIALVAMMASGLLLYRISSVVWNFTSLGLIYGAMELYGISVLPLPSVLKWRGFHFLSRLSYGLYLNHLGILVLLYPHLHRWSGRNYFIFCAAFAICLCVSLLCALITYVLIEWPFLRFRARTFDRPQSQVTMHSATAQGPVWG